MATKRGNMANDPEGASAQNGRKNRLIAPPSLTRPLRWSGVLLFLCVAVSAAQNQQEPKELLLHLRENVMNTVGRLPKYVCTQTVDRTRYEPANPEYGTNGTRRRRSCDDTVADARRGGWRRSLSSADRLRLDVAVSHEHPGMENEMYSWRGENRFNERDLFDFVRGGAVSTGSFTSMLTSIFGNSAARFTYNGDSTRGGRLLSEFGFHIPREKSQYLYVFGPSRERNVAMAYDGTVFVDPQNGDLTRLEIRTEEPPEETGVCELNQDLEYARVHLKDSDFLLPSEAQVTVIHTDGTEAHNRITYSACHEFHGEATVRYEDGTEAERAVTETPVQTAPFSLPAGLPFKVVFTDRIDTATAAAGDLIRGRLKTAIRDRNEKLLVAEGTPVTGRILGINRFYPQASRVAESKKAPARAPSLVINVRLETVDVGGAPQPLKATFDSGVKRFMKQSSPFSVHVDLGSLDELHDHADDSDTAIFEFWDSNPDHAIKSGLESNWLTAAR
jgi:hypothetical protein